MLLSQDKITQQMADERLIQHFFKRAEDKTEELPDYAVEVLTAPSSRRLDVVGTTDKLA